MVSVAYCAPVHNTPPKSNKNSNIPSAPKKAPRTSSNTTTSLTGATGGNTNRALNNEFAAADTNTVNRNNGCD